jgi:hypothetical protein
MLATAHEDQRSLLEVAAADELKEEIAMRAEEEPV